MRRVLTSLVAAALLVASTVSLASADSTNKPSSTALERVQAYVAPSIVNLQIAWSAYVWDDTNHQILKDTSTGQLKLFQLTFQCTGWVVNPNGYVATAGHCVNPDQVRDSFYQAAASWAADCACYYSNTSLTADAIYAFSANWTLKHYDKTSARVKYDASRDSVQAAWPVSAGGVDVGKALPALVVKYQSFEAGDGALLKVDASGLPALPMISGEPTIGAHVTAIGFPGSVDNVTDADLEPSYKDGSLGSQSTENNGLTSVYEISAATSGGMSGGPVVDDSGSVMGFVDFKNATETQAFNFMRPVSTIGSLLPADAANQLDANATAYRDGLTAYFDGDKVTAVKDLGTVVDAQPTNKYATEYLAKAKTLPDPPKSHTVLYIGGGLAALVVILGAVLGGLMLVKRGKGKSGPPSMGMPMPGTPQPAPPVGMPAGMPMAAPGPQPVQGGMPAGFGAATVPVQAPPPQVPAAPPQAPVAVQVAGPMCRSCGAAQVPGQHFCGSCGSAY